MNQPEFILADSEKTHHMESLPDSFAPNWDQVAADLEELCLQAIKLESMCLDSIISIQGLVQSLREQV